MAKNLFSEFHPSSKDAWTKQALLELRGKDFDQVLKSLLWRRIELQPFYTLEDLDGKVPVQHRFHQEASMPGLSPRTWNNIVSVLPGDTSKSVLNKLENGAEGLILHLSGFEDLARTLDGVRPEYIPMLVKPTGNPIAAMSSFLAWVETQQVSGEEISGALLWTPSDLVFEQNDAYGLALEIFHEVMELTEPFPNFRSFTLKTSRYTEAGGNPLDALVFGLGELIELIDQSGGNPERVFNNMLIEVSVADSHFGEIARLKAFRTAVVSLARLYSIKLPESELLMLGQTSGWSKSILDANTNLIRQTYEAMSAVLGGVNLLWTKPLLETNARDWEKRIALNVSSILREEAYLDKVEDPSSGAFFLEKIVDAILSEVRDGLSRLEEKGGWHSALQSGEIHSRVRAYRAEIQTDVAEKLVSKIGANKFPASGDLINDLEFEFFEEKSFELNPTRASYLVELQNHDAL
ncbi:hypothetical protein J0A67_19905 [Algoriphagus aestuariicola]|uniref:Methylmalonyl-CoA mutase alpha/beta chain catalytic domain-containing protein n=1 Tax=Algoriphagus aestuariicola TaxID=1852016 RepID=A0ABS3BWF7_9BACT|nr:methylmalonyl-CoA mutase family protein [Algoriphagus aestuariicola]MBN7803149.1 hypothetical protein [Algoriphagus aestuariicola]